MIQTDLHCQCILSILPASVHQFYANIFVFVNINPFLYINDQFALKNVDIFSYFINQFALKNVELFPYIIDQFSLSSARQS
jgi:hypothetical protein